jgi:hypothetical protein
MAMAGCWVALAVAASTRLHAETAPSAASGAFAVPVSTKKSDRLGPAPFPASAATAGMATNATMPPSTATAVQSPTAAPPAPAPVAASPATSALADDNALGEIEWAKPPAETSASDGRLNPTDRTIELTLPLRDGQFYLGDVSARVSPQDEISLARERFVQMMTPLLRTASLESLKTITDADGYLPLAAIKEKGFEAGFDPAKIELQIAPTIEQRATGQLSAGAGRGRVISENLAEPAIFAGSVNIRAGAD